MFCMSDYDADWWTEEAMMKYGGSFAKLLGEAARHADAENLRRIKTGWPEYWERYSRLGENLRKEQEKLP